MNIHKEVHFEAEICERMAALGWLYEADSAARHDRPLALFPEDLEAWVKASQPKAWAALQSSHGANTTQEIYDCHLLWLRRKRDWRVPHTLLANVRVLSGAFRTDHPERSEELHVSEHEHGVYGIRR